MEISNQLKEVYDYLSVYNRRFLEYVDQTPGGAERELYEELFRVNNDLHSMQPWPVFAGPRAQADIADMTIKVFRLIKDIPFRVFDGDCRKMSDFYGMPEPLVEYLLDGVTPEDLDPLLARGDYILSPSGAKCIECNVNTRLGGSETQLWEAAYLSVPLIRRFLDRQGLSIRNRPTLVLMLRHVVRAALNRFGDSQHEINIFVGLPRWMSEQRMAFMKTFYQGLLDNALPMIRPGLRGSVNMGLYPELTAGGDGIFFRGKRMHVLLERCAGYVSPEVREVFKQNEVVVCNGAVTWLMDNKLNLAVLSEHERSDIFTPGEREIIKKHIPWTRKLVEGRTVYHGESIDLVDFILANRERFVLKPMAELGGKDVYLGAKTSAARWKEVVERALKTGSMPQPPPLPGSHMDMETWDQLNEGAFTKKLWLVQETVESYPFLFQCGDEDYEPHRGAWGFFAFGDDYGGGWTRIQPYANPYGVVNSHRGAEISLILETPS